MEQRERERERLLHQQRLAAESAKQMVPVIRDRSPMRNGIDSEIRVKEEPRQKEEEPMLLSRTADPRYHPYLRHPASALQQSMLDRSRILPPTSLPHHYPPPPPASHWPPPTDPYYRYEPLRYNPLVDAAMRAEEERAKLYASYAHPGQLRPKEAGLMHLRPGTGPGPPMSVAGKICATPPTDIHKKEEPR